MKQRDAFMYFIGLLSILVWLQTIHTVIIMFDFPVDSIYGGLRGNGAATSAIFPSKMETIPKQHKSHRSSSNLPSQNLSSSLGNHSVLFLSQHPEFGSATMRGRHFIDQWTDNLSSPFQFDKRNDRVTKCGRKPTSQCADICIFIGPCDSHDYPTNYSCCTKKVLDVVDKYLGKTELVDDHLDDYDAIIVNSNYMRDYFRNEKNYMGEMLVLLHHYDPRWEEQATEEEEEVEVTKGDEKRLRFGYIGTLAALRNGKYSVSCFVSLMHLPFRISTNAIFSGEENFLYYRNLKKRYPITMANTPGDGTLPSTRGFQMDVSIRRMDEEALLAKFKTSAKVATAAALGHNIITTWEEAVKDCLPPDYPFILTDSSFDSVTAMFDMAIEDYEGDQTLWKKGLRMMEGVKVSLSLSKIA